MKRTNKRLRLAKQTIRPLTGQESRTVAGGGSSGPCEAVDTWFHLPSNFCVRAADRG